VIVRPELEPIVDPNDPDDWRPRSRWALAADPDVGLTVILEEIAPGDRIPLHRHRIDEVLVYDGGRGEVVLGETHHEVGAGSVAFVAAGTPHGTINTGSESLRVRAFFATCLIDIEYLERNAAPGTEGDAPQPPVVYDARTGEVTAA